MKNSEQIANPDSIRKKDESGDEKNGSLTQVAASYSGPLPLPRMFEQYNEVVPGAAERILKMAEKQSEHRHKIEEKIVNTETAKSKLGLWLAFCVVVIGMLTGAYLILNNKEISGLVSMFGPLAVIAGMFIYREKKKVD